ncbi:MAG: hypothetical protein H6813_01945 [Phycisphaeraceae bacterium]|nr:hypothetical protein [Phycisphaeraceae bacterium]
MMRSRPLLQTLAASLVLAATALTAPAQLANDASDAQISAYASDKMAGLSGGDPLVVRKARADLLAPLRRADVESGFRLKYSSALQQAGLERLASDADDLVAINAIVVAGELATQLSVNVAEKALRDQREAVRYEAARSVGALLRAADLGAAAIPENQIDALFGVLRGRFGEEPSVQVIDAMIVALSAPSLDPELRTRCVAALCDGAASAAQRWRDQPDEQRALTVFRAIDNAYSELLAVQGSVDRGFAQSAAVASGQALVFLMDWLRAQPPTGMTEAQRQLAKDLGAAAERVLLLAHNALTGDLQDERLTRPLKDFVDGKPGARLENVRAALEPWIGAKGRLHAAPYNVPASAFN